MTSTAEQSDRFTQGALLWPLLGLAAPLIATQLLQTLYNVTDTFWVGRLGQEAVSALSYAWPIVFLIISVGGGMTAAGTILVSQNTGAKNDGRVDEVAGQTLSFVTLLAAAFAALGVVFAPQLLGLVGAESGTAVKEMAVVYTRIIFLGLPFTFGFFVFMALLRGWGDTKTPMYLMVGSVGLNLLLDPLFILGFDGNPLFAWLGLGGLESWLYAATGFTGFGVEGAAAATILSRGLAAGVGLWLLFSGRVGIALSPADLRLELATIRKLLDIGVPLSVEVSTQAIALSAMTAFVAVIGDDAVAAYGIGVRYTTLVWMPMVGMGMAVETVVGQNLGAGRPQRARRTVLLASAILVSAFAVVATVTVLYAEPIVGIFIAGENAAPVVAYGAGYLAIVAPTWAIMVVFHMVNGALHGAGATRLSMLLGIATLWGFQAVGAAVLLFWTDMGATGIWYAIAAANVVSTIAGIAVFWHGGWLDDVLDEENSTNDDPADESKPGDPATA